MSKLSRREREVCNLIAAGKTNQEIATELKIAYNTVQNHITRIFLKLNVRDRVNACLVIQKLKS